MKKAAYNRTNNILCPIRCVLIAPGVWWLHFRGRSALIKKGIFSITFFLFFSSSILANHSGNEMLKHCKAFIRSSAKGGGETVQEVYDSGLCRGYIDGVYAGYSIGAQSNFVIPDGVTSDQLVSIFIKYVENNPKKLHWDASFLVVESLEEAFPAK